jgi:hypothetical protein
LKPAEVVTRLSSITVPLWVALLAALVMFWLTVTLLEAYFPARHPTPSYGVLGTPHECIANRVYAGICDDGWLTYRTDLINPCEGHGLAKVWLTCPPAGNVWQDGPYEGQRLRGLARGARYRLW